MHLPAFGASFIIFALARAQRPADTSICDYYTSAIFGGVNNASNQEIVILSIVNTAVIGNYTKDAQKTGVAVPGILASNATYNGTAVNLLPYFDGTLASSNIGKPQGSSVNWLDDGGAAPLAMAKPSNGNSSHQYALMTHLYTYFGAVLGCSEYGKGKFPTYAGTTSMYEVHKFMVLDHHEVAYFIEQVGLSAASWGVSADDVTTVGTTLNKVFGYRCEAAASVLPSTPPELQSICTNDSCPTAANSTCSPYPSIQHPLLANGSVATGTSSPHPSSTKSGAVDLQPVAGAVLILAGAMVMLLLQ